MKRFDCFLLRDEHQMAQHRIDEYEDLVDVFVIVVGSHTFGDYSPLQLPPPLTSKREVRMVCVPTERDATAWEREYTQRNAILHGLDDAEPDDIVWIGDVDEWPDREQAAIEPDAPFSCWMRQLVSRPTLEHPERQKCTIICRRKDIDTPQELRNLRRSLPAIPGGFHLSWFPGTDGWLAKSKATAHTEVADVDAAAMFAQRRHVTGDELHEVTPDETWPKAYR